MIGSVTKAFITALRESNLIEKENVSVVIANDDGEGTVNTALPAIAIFVRGNDRDVGEFIGGLIQNEYIVQLAVITPFDNQAASADDDTQYDSMDLPYKVMTYIAQCARGSVKTEDGKWVPVDYFKKLGADYDFNINYRGLETEQTRAMEREMGDIDVFVTRLIYVCNFVSKELVERGDSAPLEGFTLDCGCGTTIKDKK